METSPTETKVKNANLGIGTPSKWYALTKHIMMELFFKVESFSDYMENFGNVSLFKKGKTEIIPSEKEQSPSWLNVGYVQG